MVYLGTCEDYVQFRLRKATTLVPTLVGTVLQILYDWLNFHFTFFFAYIEYMYMYLFI